MTTEKFKRQSIRLGGYDYSSQGAYFVTICTQNRQYLFGDIITNQMHLNEYGEIIQNEWLRNTTARTNVELDEFVIMPNHVHGIIIITNEIARRGVLQYAPTNRFRSPSQTIGSIIRGYKSTTTKQINILRKTQNSPIWQRNYFEHVVRDDFDLNRIRQYIIDNPKNWDSDSENPNNFSKTNRRITINDTSSDTEQRINNDENELQA